MWCLTYSLANFVISNNIEIYREQRKCFIVRLHWMLLFRPIKKTFVLKIILHNYILYKGDPTYVAIFPCTVPKYMSVYI